MNQRSLMRSRKAKLIRRVIWAVVILFILMNVVAIFHAYKFTHFSKDKIVRTKDPANLGVRQKLTTLIFGVNNPRPTNDRYPTQKFEAVTLQSNKKIECWYIPHPTPKGTVIIYHGFSGNKSLMLDKADEFYKLGYNTFLVDFMGSGASEGNQPTVGGFEADQVAASFDGLQ